jgi:hypothetical protein
MSRIQRIADGLKEAAKSRRTVSFPELFAWSELGTKEPKHAAFQAMEEAAAILGDRAQVAYDALMAKRDDNLPGSGFFDAFKNNRAAEYEHLFGDLHPVDLSEEQKRQFVELERERVYDHARAG